MADITDFQIGQGETFKVLMRLFDQGNNNTPLDITNYVFTGQVRENYTTDEVAADLTFIKATPYTSGSVFILMPTETTAQLSLRKYVYDVTAETGTATRRILEGGLTVRPSVTR